MRTLINIADIVDPTDPEGRTYREINAAMVHRIPVGTLVELEDGCRLFVVHHARDCDGTPLYCLAVDPEDTTQEEAGRYNRHWHNGYSEESLTVVRLPS